MNVDEVNEMKRTEGANVDDVDEVGPVDEVRKLVDEVGGVIEGGPPKKPKRGPFAHVVAVTWHLAEENEDTIHAAEATMLARMQVAGAIYVAMCIEPTAAGVPHGQITMIKCKGQGFDLGVLSKRLDGAWCKKAIQPRASIAYCLHTGPHAEKPAYADCAPIEWGRRPTDDWLDIKQGSRTDIRRCAEDVLAGKTDKELALKHCEVVARYPKFVSRLRAQARGKPTDSPFPFVLPNGEVFDDPNPLPKGMDMPAKKRHILIYGKTNGRKSGWLYEQFRGKRVFYCRNTKYPFEGYDQEEVVIWNMFAPRWQEIEAWTEWIPADTHVPGDTRYEPTMMHAGVTRTLVIMLNYRPHWGEFEEPFNSRFWVFEHDKIATKELAVMPDLNLGGTALQRACTAFEEHIVMMSKKIVPKKADI